MDHEFAYETLTVDRQGQPVARTRHTARQTDIDLGGGVLLALVAVHGGEFQMGSLSGAGYPDETPQHAVSLSPFLLGKYPVTHEQWAAVMGPRCNGFGCGPARPGKQPEVQEEPAVLRLGLPLCRFAGPRRPVENVTWYDAAAFCRRLSAAVGMACRLPTEAEWEYACRAGAATPFACGETITTDLANYVGIHTYAGEPPGDYRHSTIDAGSFPPNAFGLYDMHGNLREWCADPWHPDYRGAPEDGAVMNRSTGIQSA